MDAPKGPVSYGDFLRAVFAMKPTTEQEIREIAKLCKVDPDTALAFLRAALDPKGEVK